MTKAQKQRRLELVKRRHALRRLVAAGPAELPVEEPDDEVEMPEVNPWRLKHSDFVRHNRSPSGKTLR